MFSARTCPSEAASLPLPGEGTGKIRVLDVATRRYKQDVATLATTPTTSTLAGGPRSVYGRQVHTTLVNRRCRARPPPSQSVVGPRPRHRRALQTIVIIVFTIVINGYGDKSVV